MHTIKIPHYLFSRRILGVATDKLTDGDNLVLCTYKNSAGKIVYPKGIVINKQEAIDKYGIERIQKDGNLMGVWLPMSLFIEANKEKLDADQSTA